MDRAVQGGIKLHIENQRLVQKIQDDLKRYDVIYMCAPAGWGKYTFLKNYTDRIAGEYLWVETAAELDAICQAYPEEECIFVIPRMESLLQEGKQEQLWRMLTEKNRYQKFIIASAIPLPDELLLFSASRQLIEYNEDDLRPSNEEVASYYLKRGMLLKAEELLKIEKDFHNMPLCLYLLENPLRRSRNGYCKAVREQCMEDVFRYLDITFFRTFKVDEQTILMKLSCFDVLTAELISVILQITEEEAEELIHYLNLRGNVLKPEGHGKWSFHGLFRDFLCRMASRYLDISDLMNLYQRSMEYFQGKGQYVEALGFARLLEDEEKIAEYMNICVRDEFTYKTILSLEPYFVQLSLGCLLEYPRLLVVGSILEAINGDKDRAAYYERLLQQLLNTCEDQKEKEQIESCLVCLHLAMPGAFDLRQLDRIIQIMKQYPDGMMLDCHEILTTNHVSVLHGDKDYCVYMCEYMKDMQFNESIEELVKDTFGEDTLGYMYFLHAEVQYEYNHLDEALQLLSKSRTYAQRQKNYNLMTLCNLKIGDILIIRNQTEKANDFSRYYQGEEAGKNVLFLNNLHAHQMDYELLENNEETIYSWMKDHAPDENEWFQSTQYYLYLMKAKVYIWDGQYIRARMILDVLKEYSNRFDMYFLKIQIQLFEAVIYYKEENAQWKGAFEYALKLAEKYRFVRVIADEGAAVYDMLQEYAGLDEEMAESDYFKEVFKESRTQMLLYPNFLKKRRIMNSEQFSTYESDIMKLLIQGEKNADIAKKLCVSENTVKYHLKNIYQKLDVKSRSQAVHRMKELNLF